MIIDHSKLLGLTNRIVTAGGSSPTEAAIVAEHLVEANLRGHDSHGVGMLVAYVRDLDAGTLKINQTPEIVSDTGTISVWDARAGYGQVVARQAVEWAIEAARKHGVAVNGLRNAHHIGRVGTYGEIAARAARILGDVHEMVEFAQHCNNVLAGSLRLGVIPSIAPYMLPPLLPLLREGYPKLELHVRETQTMPLTQELIDGKLDVLLLALPILQTEIETMPLFDDRFLLALPQARRSRRAAGQQR